MLECELCRAPGRFSQTLYVRSIPINLDGVDTILGQTSCFQKRTVVTQLHTLAAEVVFLEQFQPVVLSVLGKEKVKKKKDIRTL